MSEDSADVLKAMLQSLQNIEATLREFRAEGRLDGRLEQLSQGLSHVSARVGETTARVLELTEISRSFYKSVGNQLEVLDNARVNLREAVQRIDAELQELRAAVGLKPT